MNNQFKDDDFVKFHKRNVRFQKMSEQVVSDYKMGLIDKNIYEQHISFLKCEGQTLQLMGVLMLYRDKVYTLEHSVRELIKVVNDFNHHSLNCN